MCEKNDDQWIALRSMAERAYLDDPRATERNLELLGLQHWIAELRIDAASGRLRGNVAAVAPPVREDRGGPARSTDHG